MKAKLTTAKEDVEKVEQLRVVDIQQVLCASPLQSRAVDNPSFTGVGITWIVLSKVQCGLLLRTGPKVGGHGRSA